MNIKLQELVASGANVTVTVDIKILKDFGDYLIGATKKELEAVVFSDKAESYPTVKSAK